MKYALITGANRGLGLGFAEELITSGYFVFMGMRHDDNEFHHDNARTVVLDVEDDQSIMSVVATLQSQGVVLDVLINNAGVSKRSASVGSMAGVNELTQLNREALLHMFNVNAVSPMLLTRHALPLLTAQPSFIINISSGRASFQNEGSVGNYGYRASKVALNMFTKASVLELPENVYTFAVHPGLVRSDMNPDGDIEPQDAARKILEIMNDWDEAKSGAFLDNEGNYFDI